MKFFRPILPFCAVFLNEHTYAMDYGANTAAYIDAFKNLQWDEVNRRAEAVRHT